MEEKLIEAVRKRPILYDKTHPSYHNRDEIRMLWQEVAGEVGGEGKRFWSFKYMSDVIFDNFYLNWAA